MASRSLYVHIPFCLRKCFYCDFYLEPLGSGPLAGRFDEVDRHDQSPFLDALELEMARLPSGLAPSSLYVGGGTPTELSQPDFDRLFQLVETRIDTSASSEWTVEANPGTLKPGRIDRMRRAGVNRISLGAQSFVPRNLEFLTRIHTAPEAERAVLDLRSAGFKNINLDLIFGVPGSTLDDVRTDLDAIARLRPQHVSWYCLDFVHGTVLTDLRDRGMVQELDDDSAVSQYELIRASLPAMGYEHYEIFNFGLPGHQSVHNRHYWFAGEYYGLGPSAHAHLDGSRRHNVKSLREYVRKLKAGESPVVEEEHLAPEAKAREILMTSSRYLAGVENSWFKDATGFDLFQLGGETLDGLIRDGWFVREGDRLRMCEKTFLVANRILSELI